MLEYKVAKAGYGNLMPNSMFKTIFSRCTNADLGKSIYKKVVLKTYNSLHVQKLGAYRVKIIHKKILTCHVVSSQYLETVQHQ